MEVEAFALNNSGFKPRPRRDFKRKGVIYRRCVECGEVKPRDSDFYRSGRAFYQTCKVCARPKRTAYNRQRMKSQAKKDALNARLKTRRENDPEYRRKANEASKRWRKKRAREKGWRQAQREKARIAHRLKREQQGVPLEAIRKIAKVKRHGQGNSIPTKPLLMAVSRYIEQRKEIARVLDDPEHGKQTAICRDLGLNERLLRSWEEGLYETVQIGVAERIMDEIGLEPSEVFSRDDYPEALALFEEVEINAK